MLDVYTIVADNSIATGGTGTNITAFDLSFFGKFAQVQNAIDFSTRLANSIGKGLCQLEVAFSRFNLPPIE